MEFGALAAAEKSFGISAEEVQNLADNVAPGTSAAILMIEHTWAAGLKAALREAGGYPLMEGFLTPEALFMVGKELEAMVEAEAAIEMADAVKGAAMLEMLATVATAEAIEETAIEEAAAQEAIDALVVAGLIEAAAVEEAADAVAQAEAVVEEAWSATEDADDTDTASVAEIA